MPRDAGGNYTLAAGNPVVAGTIIRPSWANPTMDDLAIEMTDSLSRSGKGGMLVPFLNVDGAVNLPGIAFTNEPSLGLFREGNNEMRAGVAATDSTRWIAGDFGFEIWSGTAWVKPLINGAQTITGVQTFADTAIFTKQTTGGVNASTVVLSSLNVQQTWNNEAEVVDNKAWNWIVSASTLSLRVLDDAWLATGTVPTFMTFTRSIDEAISVDWFISNNFNVSPILSNNIPLQGFNTTADTRIDLIKVSAGNVIQVGSTVLGASLLANTSFGVEIDALLIAQFVDRASGALLISDSAATFSKAMRLGGNKQTITNTTSLANDNHIFGDISTGGEVRVIGMTAADIIQIGQNSSVINGVDYFSGAAASRHLFKVSTTDVLDINTAGAAPGMNYKDGSRIFFEDSLGTPFTAIFFQGDTDLRLGGTGMPQVSLRTVPQGIINFVVGTTVSQEFTENSIVCKSKGVTTANESHLQFQDLNGLNTGKVGNLAGFDDLFIQGQGGQNVRFECLSVSFDALTGTTASAANARLDGATKNLLVSTSARRYKKDIVPIARAALNKVLDMAPIRYRSKSKADDPNQEHYGLVAEDVYKVDPRLVSMVNGKPDGVQYERVAVLLLGVVQDMAKRLKVLENA